MNDKHSEDGKMVLRSYRKKERKYDWTVFNFLRRRPSPARERLRVSQEGLCSMELVTCFLRFRNVK
jgi:hypothetical protein